MKSKKAPTPQPSVELTTTPARHAVKIKDGKTFHRIEHYGSEPRECSATLARNEGSEDVELSTEGFVKVPGELLADAFTRLLNARAAP